jgi:hypothetical protein
MSKMKIAFVSKNFPGKYSGGRLHAWTMAEGFAANGYLVDFYTDYSPVFFNDFTEFPGHENINLLVSKYFIFNIKEKYNLIVVIPHLISRKSIVFDKFLFNPLVRRLKKLSKSKLLMLDFESPNWAIERLTPIRTIRDYKYQNELIKYTDIILSTTKTGLDYALEYYKDFNPNLVYKQLYVSINSLSAKKVGYLTKKDQIIYFARFKEKYKGTKQFLNIVNCIPTNFELIVIGNREELEPEILRETIIIEESNSIKVSFKYKISDFDKFRLISESKLLLFNSDFEGYGLPPIEAQYLGTEVLCSELPVLKEVNRYANFVNFNDKDQLRSKILNLIKSDTPSVDIRKRVSSFAEFEKYSLGIENLMVEILK